MKTILIWLWACFISFASTMYAQVTQQVTALQYYYNSDPGVGIAGNGAIINVTPTDNLDQAFSFLVPASLTNGIHQLYVRCQDEYARWSVSERRMFYVSDIANGTRNIVAYQYYVDLDPGVGVAGNGGIIPVTSTASLNTTVAITLPTLSNGIHQLYIRTKDDAGRWSIAERRMFYISDVVNGTRDITTLEYYFDLDPGVGNATPYPITPTSDFNQIVDLGVPCLSTGTHYLYIRAKDTANRWSIIDRDTLVITSGIEPSVVSPAGPLTICDGSSVTLSTTPVSGFTYKWLESGVPIAGETDPSLTVTSPGSYALQTICGSFVLSNTVEVSVMPVNIYYADADGDGYGDPTATVMDCTQPTGYVVNDDDCDDTNASIHPSSAEICNLVDDDCDGEVDEGVQTMFYADADNDGYGDAASTTQACTAPSGYVANSTDCNDNDASVNPGATEICNGKDDNCDGLTDEDVLSTFYADADADGYGDAASTALACTAPSGYVTNSTDCNDASAAINPGATETCNGMDDDCDGLTDDEDSSVEGRATWYADFDGDGYGNASSPLTACDQPTGYVLDNSDCDDSNGAIYPLANEACNGIDDNCDGIIPAEEVDSDGDGYRICQNDCNDEDATIHPGAEELCSNTIDDDCDGLVNEGCGAALMVDAGTCQVVFYGYAPQACTTLTAEVSGGITPYAYSWSNGGTSASISVCPNATTVYSVTVTDHVGATAVNGVTVEVVDVHCGNNNDKVLVCHNPSGNSNTLCVAQSAVADHLAHGDYLGPCGNSPCSGVQFLIAPENTVAVAAAADFTLAIFPNPADNEVTFHLHGFEDEAAELILFDYSGRAVWQTTIEEGQHELTLDLSDDNFASGIYMVKINSRNDVLTKWFVISK